MFHALLFLSWAIGGCAPQSGPLDYRSPLPPGQVALVKLDPKDYPNFAVDPADLSRVRSSISNSLQYLAAPSSKNYFPYLDITHDRAVATLRGLDDLIAQATAPGPGPFDPARFNATIVQQYDVYKSVGAPRADGSGYSGRVLFTGYFTPIYDASLTRSGPYQWPLYKLPPDLVRDPATGQTLGRRLSSGAISPYYTRGEIETGNELAGQELVWLRDRWQAYVVTVQGSARLRLSDGRIYEIGYAGTNGYDYKSPGLALVADHRISSDQLSLRALGDYFAAHPQDMDHYLSMNPRTEFFTERPGGPFGKLNVPVTPMATIATDKATRDIYPRAMPAFLDVAVPADSGDATRPFHGFMLDQDSGGAILASGRCDIFMGVGPGAEQLAGRELHEGALYYIAIKPQYMTAYLATSAR